MRESKEFEAVLGELDAMKDFLLGQADAYLRDGRLRLRLELSLEEILVNIIDYAYAGGKGPVWLGFEYDEGAQALCFRFEDAGQPYDPLQYDPQPDCGAGLEKCRIGGLGIFL